MRIIFPPPNSATASLLDALRRAFPSVLSQDEAAPRVLLKAPNGTVYALTVDNAGTLSTAVVDGNSRP